MDDGKLVSVGRDSIKLTASKFITTAISLVCAMLLSRFRTLSEYGTYSQLLLVINLFTSLFMLGLPNSINFFLARAETQEQKRKFLSVYYTLSTILSMLLGLALVLSVPLIESYFNNSGIRHFVYFLALYPWSKIISSSIGNVLVVYKKTNRLMVYRITNSVALLAIIFITKLFDLGFSVYMMLFVLVESVYAIIVYITVIHLAGGIDISFDFKYIRRIFAFSIPIGLASVIGTLDIELDKLMIGNLLETEALAIYTNASKEMPFNIITSSVTAVVMPAMVTLLKKGKTDQVVGLWKDVSELIFIPLCFFSCMFIAFAPQVMYILYGIKYVSGYAVFRVYCLLIMIRFTYFGMILNSSGKTNFVFYSSIASLLLNVSLNYLFFYLFGMIGPAIASVTSVVAMSLFQLTFSAKILGIKFSQIMPWKKFFKNLCVCGLFSAAAYLLLKVISKYLPHEIIYEPSHIALMSYIAIAIGAVFAVVYFLVNLKKIRTIWKKIR